MREKNVTVGLGGDILAGLQSVAKQEKRWLSQQVLYFIQEGLERRGLLPTPDPTPAAPAERPQ